MQFHTVRNFKLMKLGEQPNGMNISEDMIRDFIFYDRFQYSPIVLNKNKEFTDYANSENVEEYFKEKIIGVVSSCSTYIDNKDGYVKGEVLLLDEYANRTGCDNWYIELDETGRELINYNCELFGKEDEFVRE